MKKFFLALLFTVLLPLAANATVINWVDNSDNEEGFNIYRSDTALGVYVKIATVAANVATYNDVNGVPGQCYRVTAFVAGLESQPSNSDCKKHQTPNTPNGTTAN